MGIISKIIDGLKKTQQYIGFKLKQMFKVGVYDEDFFDDVSAILLSSDVGGVATEEIVLQLKDKLEQTRTTKPEQAYELLKQIMSDILPDNTLQYSYPCVIMVCGVNGVGKTTTIGKLANNFTKLNKSVVVAAADTFRAAACDQLEIWAKRSKVRIVKQCEGADPAAVVFDAITSVKSRRDDVLIIDTAGRLHNKVNLMEELKKINRIIVREFPDAMKLNLVVLDATTGQNALSQVETFNEAVSIDGIVLTKLDGTAKGGVVYAIASQLDVPVYYVGVGEGIDDLIEFDKQSFVKGIFD